MFVIGEGMMLKLMSEYNYHSGIRLRIYPSYQQKRIIKKNAETARFIYNEMIFILWIFLIAIPGKAANKLSIFSFYI